MFPPNFISIERIGSRLDIGSKKRVLQHLGEMLATGAPNLSPNNVFDRLLERERLGSTGLGHGIALPHARAKEAHQAVGAFIQLQKAVDFDAIDDQPVDLVFGLLVPQNATEEHLQLLARLANMFNNPELREQLRECASSEELLRHIESWEEEARGESP